MSIADKVTTASELVEYGAWGARGLDWAIEQAAQIDSAHAAALAAKERECEELRADALQSWAACCEAINSLEWTGDGYEWNPKHGDYRERTVDALNRGKNAWVEALAKLTAENAALKARVEALQKGWNERITFAVAGPHVASEECPTWYDGCNCGVVKRLESRLTAAHELLREVKKELAGIASVVVIPPETASGSDKFGDPYSLQRLLEAMVRKLAAIDQQLTPAGPCAHELEDGR